MEHGTTSHWNVILPVIVNFTGLVLLLYFATRKGFASAIATRSEKVGHSVVEAQKAYTEASTVENEWRSKWNGLKGEVAQLFSDAQAAQEKQRTLALERAEQEVARVQQDAKLVAQGELDRATNQLRKELAHRSVELAGKYLESHLGEDDRKSLVKNYTEIVGNGTTR